MVLLNVVSLNYPSHISSRNVWKKLYKYTYTYIDTHTHIYMCIYIASISALFFASEINIYDPCLRKSKVCIRNISALCTLHKATLLCRSSFSLEPAIATNTQPGVWGTEVCLFSTSTHRAACPQLLACYLSGHLTTSVGR